MSQLGVLVSRPNLYHTYNSLHSQWNIIYIILWGGHYLHDSVAKASVRIDALLFRLLPSDCDVLHSRRMDLGQDERITKRYATVTVGSVQFARIHSVNCKYGMALREVFLSLFLCILSGSFLRFYLDRYVFFIHCSSHSVYQARSSNGVTISW
jgi:hypothetical protein